MTPFLVATEVTGNKQTNLVWIVHLGYNCTNIGLTRFPTSPNASLVHHQNEKAAGSESIPQWHLGSFGRTRFERGQAEMPRQCNCCVPGCTNSHNCSNAAFLLFLSLIPFAFAILFRPCFQLLLVMANRSLEEKTNAFWLLSFGVLQRKTNRANRARAAVVCTPLFDCTVQWNDNCRSLL